VPGSDFLSFVPYLRPTLWGGDRLRNYRKPVAAGGSIGESWEVSGHPLHVSRVADGPQRGRVLTELWDQHAEDWTAGEYRSGERFPLLVKLLDCRLPCSVQVHPDEPDFGGERRLPKTEAWTVLAAEPGARVYAGLNARVKEADLRSALRNGTVLDLLHGVEPRVGDCFLITPGVVHTMQGVLLAEFQTSSDATLRLFDWNRLDLDGRKREIHVEESLSAIDWIRGPVSPVTPQRLSSRPAEVASEGLVEIPEFHLTRHTLTGRWTAPASDIFSIWMLARGEVALSAEGSGPSRQLRAGDTLLIPPPGGLQIVPSDNSPAVLLECTIGR
jgi:mannose-6-phosphate isomerase